MFRIDVRHPVVAAGFALLAFAGMVGIVLVPQYAYPLLWVSPLCVFVFLQVVFREASIFDDAARGSWGPLVRFVFASFFCGVIWEMWNYYSLARWIYSVTFAYGLKVFEMPLAGFGGYLPFGLECAAVTAWLSPRLVRPVVK